MFQLNTLTANELRTWIIIIIIIIII